EKPQIGAFDLDRSGEGTLLSDAALAVPLESPFPSAIEAPSVGPAAEGVWVVDAVDRKSTRLNSSHVEISYAVFCLKKKIAITSVEADRELAVVALYARGRGCGGARLHAAGRG